MKVLFVSGVRGISGAEIVLARFIRQNPDIQSVVLLPRGDLYDHLAPTGVRLYRSRGLGQLRRRQSKWWALCFLLRWFISTLEVLRVCWKERPDIIHAGHFAAAVYSIVPSKLLGIPLTWHIHDIFPDGSVEYRACRVVAPHVDHIIAVSQAVRDALIRNGVPPKKVIVIHNGIDAEQVFNPGLRKCGSLRRQFGFADETQLIGMIGLLTEWKGAHIFLEAVARLRPKLAGREVRFLVIGDSWNKGEAYKDFLHEKVRTDDTADLVQFTGRLDNMADVLADLDVVVHCSTAPDPFPTVVLEAMAMGKVLIAAEGGGVPEMVKHGVTGLLCRPGDADSLTELLEKAIQQFDALAPLGSQARAYVRQHFTCSAVRATFLRVWLDSISQSQRRDKCESNLTINSMS